jgi:D-alanine-D-alanine ligase
MKIGVFFGSRSPEHDVSIITGQLIISGLKELGHEVIPVYIDKAGKWYVSEELGNLDFFKQKNYEDNLKNLHFSLDLSQKGKFIMKKVSMFGGTTYEIELGFPAFHGQNGEDGTIQGLFELMNIPYVGCDVASSAISIDKVLTKMMYKSVHIPTAEFVYFTKSEWNEKSEKIIENIERRLKYPIFVKPSRLGSSIGISRVENKKDLEFAIEVALHYDTKVLVEEAIENLMDVTIAIIGNETLLTSKIQQSVFSEGFFSYEDKYISEGGAQLGNAEKKIIIPANLEPEIAEKISETAKDAYRALGCSGIARVDFLYDIKSKKFFANELNSLPGTLYHHLWKESGIDFKELLTKLIQFADEKYSQKQKLDYSFESKILSQSNSKKLSNKLS